MKLLHLSAYYAPRLGGVETHLQQLNKEFIKQGHQVWVMTQQHQKDLPLTEDIDGVHVVRLVTDKQYGNKLFEKLNLWQQISRHAQLMLQADVIQVHDVYWWLLPLLPLFWSKIYLTFHGWEGKFPIPWRYKLARQIWSRLALKTIHVGKYIQEFYGDKPDKVIYGGINNPQSLQTSLQTSRLSVKNGLGKTPLQIVFVGRLEAENDLSLYLEAARLLTKTGKIKITWVGDGIFRDDCKKYGTVTGMIKNVDRYLAQADLVWSASYLSMLQAQAQGKIVAALYGNDLKERYLKTYPGARYMLVNNNPDQISQQIKVLIERPDLRKRYQKQAQNWAQQQTWKKVAQVYQQLWQRGKTK